MNMPPYEDTILFKERLQEFPLKVYQFFLSQPQLEVIERKILLIREQKVMLDSDLAEIYNVPTKVLNQALKRNRDRFPDDFMFQLTKEEKKEVVTPHAKKGKIGVKREKEK